MASKLERLTALAIAAQQAPAQVVLSAETLFQLIDHAATNEPCPGAPREDHDGSPCWCNGPYQAETDHFPWCRTRRHAWRVFLQVCNEINPGAYWAEHCRSCPAQSNGDPP